MGDDHGQKAEKQIAEAVGVATATIAVAEALLAINDTLRAIYNDGLKVAS